MKRIAALHIRFTLVSLFLFTILLPGAVAQPTAPIFINTTVVPPVSPYLNQVLSATGRNIRVIIRNSTTATYQVKVFAQLERLSPSPFTIAIDPTFPARVPIAVPPAPQQVELSPALLEQTFAGFNESYLNFDGIALSDIKEGINYKLPEGNYRICFYAVDYSSGQVLTGSNQGCAFFNICYQASAPQFTQPVNNFNVSSSVATVRPSSPLIFTWTPPQATCGLGNNAYTYDLEIREILDQQAITDAINNPYIFRKTTLPSTTFLLDTNLYRNVLQSGKRYIIRVRANKINLNSPIVVENNGYSRIEAFQYGEGILTSITGADLPEPQAYYLPFRNRKSDFWDDVATAYANRSRGDTLMPVREYIALSLMQHGIVYNTDAIELFLLLNPELSRMERVKLSRVPRLPVYPAVRDNVRREMEEAHKKSLLPDRQEGARFRTYLDSLQVLAGQLGTSGDAARTMNELLGRLQAFNRQLETASGASVKLANDLLAELLFRWRNSPVANRNKADQDIQALIADLQEITLQPATSSFYRNPFSPRPSSLSASGTARPGSFNRYYTLVHYGLKYTSAGYSELPLGPIDPLLPFDVIVFQTKTPPPVPVLDAPELNNKYRIFYTPASLFNPKNPSINAGNTRKMASTAQVSLPQNVNYKFWTLNMLNHQLSKPVDVDTRDVFLNSRKRWPNRKNLSIVLKVD